MEKCKLTWAELQTPCPDLHPQAPALSLGTLLAEGPSLNKSEGCTKGMEGVWGSIHSVYQTIPIVRSQPRPALSSTPEQGFLSGLTTIGRLLTPSVGSTELDGESRDMG